MGDTGRWPREAITRKLGGALLPPHRLNVCFNSLQSLRRFLEEELPTGLITVPSRWPATKRQQVELSLTLPACRHMLQTRAVVERIEPETPHRQRMLVLRLVSRMALITERLRRFLEQCPHKPCFREQYNERLDELCDVAGSLRDRRRSPAPSARPAAVARTSSITSRPTPTPVPRTRRRQRTNRQDRSLKLVDAAIEAYDQGDRLQAISLLRLALSYDRRNLRTRALLRYLSDE